jgi:hypothetical protein
VPSEFSWVPNDNPTDRGVQLDDNAAWAQTRDEWANHMWANRGNSCI